MASYAITGSSGMIGNALVGHLRRAGHTVHRVVRSRAAATGGDIYWSVDRHEIDRERLEGLDGVVHLAGAPIGAHRWTTAVKQEIHRSREAGTRLLAEALAALDQPPPVLVSGSAVGYYGSRGDEVLREDARPGDDFVARVVVAWERSAAPAAAAGIRVVHPRTGVVLGPDSPLISKVELPFKLGVGGRIGSGRQWVPWIALEDEVRALAFLLDEPLEGPVNVTAPGPVTNGELTEAIGDVLSRPTVLPIPLLAVKLVYGEMGASLAASSQRAVPTALQAAGFTWRHPDLREALAIAFR